MSPSQHPLRHALHNEIHARPPEAMTAPAGSPGAALACECRVRACLSASLCVYTVRWRLKHACLQPPNPNPPIAAAKEAVRAQRSREMAEYKARLRAEQELWQAEQDAKMCINCSS